MRNLLTQHQLQEAYVCAYVSDVVYGESNILRRDLIANTGYEIVKEFDRDGSQLMVFQRKDHRIIAFRGTDGEPSDLVNDLKIQAQTPTPFGRVGQGVIDYVDPVLDDAIAAAIVHHAGPVTFTGHSLGAAAAIYTAMVVWHEHEERHNVITFGCPRVGDRRFAFNVNQHFPHPYHQRWVNANDIVTKIPWQLGRFVHPNALQYIDTDYNIFTSPSQLQIFLNRWGWFKNSPFQWATDQKNDHRIGRYRFAIRRGLR